MSLDSILSLIKSDLDKVEQKLEEYLSSDSPLIYQIAQYLLERKGKRLRPALVLLSFGETNSSNKDNALDAAVAIELIHTATLLHDDVIDQSTTRRGKASVNYRWSNLVSVLMGDYLLAKSFKILVQTGFTPLLKAVSKATESISLGELLQIQERGNYNLTEKVYLKIITDKTASLFSVACGSGAIARGVDEKTQYIYQRFGEGFGMSFQIIDDLLDLVGDKEKTGKELGNDLQEGKITLPLIYALANSEDGTRDKIMKILEEGYKPEHFPQICSFVQKEGGVEYGLKRAQDFGNEALELISELNPTEYKEALEKLVDFILTREK
ncbi:MAG: polyprenyl synthetase family protein [candidate division Zixibacteria bacterium]|nr:polyprenyl synthetase family protein [candidate division Zixibacteria bacterium]